MIFYNPCKKHKGSSEEDFRIFAKKHDRTDSNEQGRSGWTRTDPGTDIMRNKIDLIVRQSMMIQNAQELQAQVACHPAIFTY